MIFHLKHISTFLSGVIIGVMMCHTPVFAASTLDQAQLRASAKQSQAKADAYFKAHGAYLQSLTKQAYLKAKAYTPVLKQLMQNQPQATQFKPKQDPLAIVFVSFSMPMPLFKATLKEAHTLHLPVVLRGLVDNSMKKTVKTFYQLAKDDKTLGGLLIHPVWFERYQITQVPALVVSTSPAQCGPKATCDLPPYDVIYGNLPLKCELQLIIEKGDASNTAQTLLKRLKQEEGADV